MRWCGLILSLGAAWLLGGCSLLFDPDDHVGGGPRGDDAGASRDAGDEDDGGATDDGGVREDGGAVADGGNVVDTVDGGEVAPRCTPVSDPRAFCPGTVDVRFTEVSVDTNVVRGPSLAVVEHRSGVAAVAGLVEADGDPRLLFNQLGAEGPTATPRDDLNLAATIGERTNRPADTRSLGLARSAPGEVGFALLADPSGATDVWLGDLERGVLGDVANLSAGATPNPIYGHAAVTGPGGGTSTRFFWREQPSGGGVILASLPLSDWAPRSWRATQTGVNDTTGLVKVKGTAGSFVMTRGEATDAVQLWSGLGPDTTIDDATPVHSYEIPEGDEVRDFDLTWLGGDRYVLVLGVRTGTRFDVYAVPAECSASCDGMTPATCTSTCAFDDAAKPDPLGGVSDVRVAASAAGPDAIVLATAHEISGTWTIKVSALNAFDFTPLDNPSGVPYMVSPTSVTDPILGLDAASLTSGSAVDVAIGWTTASSYSLATFQPCLCR